MVGAAYLILKRTESGKVVTGTTFIVAVWILTLSALASPVAAFLGFDQQYLHFETLLRALAAAFGLI